MDKLALQKMAVEVRKGIVSSVHSAKAGHPGGSLSAADIFTYLYFEEMNIDPKDPKKEDRDRFVLSKGHTAPGLYSALANRGYFPVEDLLTLRHTGSYLQGHPDMKHIPGVDMSSGSLGQGLSAACGMALAGKMKQQDYRVYALCGDGEIEEGQIWEAAMFAGFRKLDNLCVIVDNNNLQIDGPIDEVCSPYPIDKKFESFHFHVINIDGNGNRVAALCYGPKQVIVIVGMNKVVPTVEIGIERAHTVASPKNIGRFPNAGTPCAKTGMCAHCTNQESICAQVVRTRVCKPQGRIKVILVGEDLGF